MGVLVPLIDLSIKNIILMISSIKSIFAESPSPGTADAMLFFILQIIIQVILLIIGIALAYGLLKTKE